MPMWSCIAPLQLNGSDSDRPGVDVALGALGDPLWAWETSLALPILASKSWAVAD